MTTEDILIWCIILSIQVYMIVDNYLYHRELRKTRMSVAEQYAKWRKEIDELQAMQREELEKLKQMENEDDGK